MASRPWQTDVVTDFHPLVNNGGPISEQIKIVCSTLRAVIITSSAYQSSLPLAPKAPESSTPRMAGAVLVPRIGGTSTKFRPEVPTRVRRTELRVDSLTIDEPQAMLGLATFHQTGPIVRYVLVGRDVLAGDEEATGALHLWISKRDRLTRSPGLLAAVLAVVVTAPSVVLVARG